MHWATIIPQALLAYLFFIPLLTLHEWAHAWTAWKCGDDTAFKRGRVSLNPIVHMSLLGTVILPLVGMITSALGTGIIIGWGKPVPVNPLNLKHPRLQDSIIAMAGPFMNLILAFALLACVKFFVTVKQTMVAEAASEMAMLSLFLCFFNLIPIPPLDGSHLIMNLARLSYGMYVRLSIAGFVAIIILLQFRWMQKLLMDVSSAVFLAMSKIWRLA
jgi:Zn-dependent protease